MDRHISRATACNSHQIIIIDEALAAEIPQPDLPIELESRDPLLRKALMRVQKNM